MKKITLKYSVYVLIAAVVFKILCHFLTMAKRKGMTHDPIQSSLRHGSRSQGIA